MRSACKSFFLVVVLAGLTGCGGVSDPYGRLPVSGSVTLNGQALAAGDITFTSASVVPVVSGSKIIDGKFKIEKSQGLPPGEYKVAITSMSETVHPSGDLMNHPTQYKELVPEEFNTKTKLMAEVKDVPENVFTFEVVSKK